MKNTFHAIGYHGTDNKYVENILNEIDYSFNKGDKFLGQGMYLWRDSYDRAYKWASKTKECENVGVIAFQIKCNKENVLNFTSQSWNKEEELLTLWQQSFSSLSLGEFFDMMIYENSLKINLIVIMDLNKEPNIIRVEDKRSIANFAFGDIQICLKNNTPIESKKEI